MFITKLDSVSQTARRLTNDLFLSYANKLLSLQLNRNILPLLHFVTRNPYFHSNLNVLVTFTVFVYLQPLEATMIPLRKPSHSNHFLLHQAVETSFKDVCTQSEATSLSTKIKVRSCTSNDRISA